MESSDGWAIHVNFLRYFILGGSIGEPSLLDKTQIIKYLIIGN